jgi:hypothetical protein
MLIRNTLLSVAGAVLLESFSVNAARVFFADQPANAAGSLVSVNCDGTDQRTVITAAGVSDFRGVAYHALSGRVYYLDNGTAKRIYSILPDGTGQQEVLPLPAAFNADLEVDTNMLYWSETASGTIQRANLNGSGIAPAVSPGTGTFTAPYFMFLDPQGGYIYWGVTSESSTPSNFRRATFTGDIDPDFSITSPTRSRDIAIDPTTQTAYWCDRQTGAIYRRALAGGANETVIGNMNAPHGIALDVEAQKVYWADTGARGNPPSGLSPRRVARCNFDGTEFENLSTPTATSEPWDLALDLSSRTYPDWRTRFFSTTTPNAQPAEDADADGAPNLLEYAMGTHPRQATSIPRLTAEGTEMRYTRRNAADLTYRIEVSADLITWHYNNEPGGGTWVVQTSSTALTADLSSVTVRAGSALAGATQVFFRLRVATP